MKKFGTFNGVFVPSFEAILGAVLFLVLPGLAAGMGMERMVIIILLANSVTIATAFSIADCTTNLEQVGAGGMYSLSKRSLGKAFGGSIGIQLYIAQTASIGFYAIGFADPVFSLLSKLSPVADFMLIRNISPLAGKQIIATVIAFSAFIAALVGVSFIVRIQMVIFIILSLSVLAIMVSPVLGLETESGPFFLNTINLKGAGLYLGFWGAFTAFFPAVTGIDAGVGMSGNLVQPKKSLVSGTFSSIAITAVVYLLITAVFSYIDPSRVIVGDRTLKSAYDIFSDFPLMQVVILGGILFATGSSALSYFMTAPDTGKTLAVDGLLPKGFSFLKKDFIVNGSEPRWATTATFLLLLPVIWSGDVTFASMVVGICFLVVYGWVNLAAFMERISGNPSYRPTSRGALVHLTLWFSCMHDSYRSLQYIYRHCCAGVPGNYFCTAFKV